MHDTWQLIAAAYVSFLALMAGPLLVIWSDWRNGRR
jgi:hypothetical protein